MLVNGRFIQQRLPVTRKCNFHPANSIGHFFRRGQLCQHILHKCIGIFRLNGKVNKPPCLQRHKFPRRFAACHLRQHKPFLLTGFPKINPFNRTGIHNGGMAVGVVQRLVLVNMPQRHIIQPVIIEQSMAQHQLIPQHHRPLTAIFGIIHTDMGSQNGGDFRVCFLDVAINQLCNAVFNESHHFFLGFAN